MQTNAARRLDTVIVGLGKTGFSVARYLARHGVEFAVTDNRRTPPCLSALLAENPEVHLSLGAFDEVLLGAARRVILSPGVSRLEPALRGAVQASAEVISDIELFAREVRAPVIAITGSNGKSTVTTLVGMMLKHGGMDVRIGGNIGTPALALLDADEPDYYVLELSSFQLESTSTLKPTAAAVLNVSEDHMDRYASPEEYAAAKARIYSNCEHLVANADDAVVMSMVEAAARVSTFGMSPDCGADFGISGDRGEERLAYRGAPLMAVSELRMRGRHNWANALAALALTQDALRDFGPRLDVLREFPGLPHRCQWIATIRGVDWFNDSKATNVGASCAAIAGLGGARDLILIAGGDGKGADFTRLADTVREFVRYVLLIGRDAERIADALGAGIPVSRFQSLQEAVRAASKIAKSGEAVLLSPACASLDMFENYEARGASFVNEVRRLEG